ncbi:MAG: cation:proton antiporter [Gemmatimonadota bacterium]
MIHQPLATFVFTLLGGGLAQLVAAWLSLPSIVFLLAFGVLLGPGLLGWVQPAVIANLPTYVELMVAVILFAGAQHLRLAEVRAHGRMVLHLLTVGLLTTFVLTALATRAILGVGWSVAVLFGALMVVTGPTVVLPLLKRIPIKENLHSILKWEGILIDPLGVILTVFVLELVLAEQPSLASTAALFGSRVLLGGALGLAAGSVVALGFRRRFFLGHHVQEIGGLAGVAVILLFYGLAESVFRESGLVCVTVAGLVLGNTSFPYKKEISAFHEQVTVVALSVLFILLAANVPLRSLGDVLRPGLVLVGVMMLAVRPASVFVSALGTELSIREKTLLALTAPRGVVAASFAFLLSQVLEEEGRSDAAVLVPTAFLVIVTTVLLNGVLGRTLARALGVYEGERRGLLIVGANALGRLVAREVSSRGVQVRLVDKSGGEVAAARAAGFPAHQGDATDPDFLEETDLKGIGKVLALTPNQEVNILACAAAARFVGDDHVFRLDDRRAATSGERGAEESWGLPLAAVTATPAELQASAHAGRLSARWDGSGRRHGLPEAPNETPTALGWPLLGVRPDSTVVFPGEVDWTPRRAPVPGLPPPAGPEVLYLRPEPGA